MSLIGELPGVQDKPQETTVDACEEQISTTKFAKTPGRLGITKLIVSPCCHRFEAADADAHLSSSQLQNL